MSYGVLVCTCHVCSQVAYHGLVSDMVPYFASIDYKCPSNFNPADFLFMSVLHAGSLSKDNDDAYDFITDKANDEDEKAKVRCIAMHHCMRSCLVCGWVSRVNMCGSV